MNRVQSFSVTSEDGEVLVFRRHALAGLVEENEQALCYEPARGGAYESRLKATSDAHGFTWKLKLEKPGETNVSLAALGRLAGAGTKLESLASSGSCAWADWSGCDAVDLIVVDENGRVSGDSISLMNPERVHTKLAFELTANPNEVWLRGDKPGAQFLRLIVWHRWQNGQWRQREDLGQVPAQGIVLEIPAYQGAFALARGAGGLEKVQFFGFGNLYSGSTKDHEEFEKYYAETQSPSYPRWPAWMRDQLIGRLEELSGLPPLKESDSTSLVAHLRNAMRRGLFENAEKDWRPELTLEAYVLEKWPCFGSLLSKLDDPGVLREAFKLRSSPDLKRAAEWANGRMSHFSVCLRLVWCMDKCESARRLLGPYECKTRAALEDLTGLLAKVPVAGEAVEPQVLEHWDNLLQTSLQEFQSPLLELTPEIIAQAMFLKSVRDATRQLGFDADATSVAEWMEQIFHEAGRLEAGPLYDLVQRGVQEGLLDRSLTQPSAAQLGFFAELQNSLRSLPKTGAEENAKRLAAQLSQPRTQNAIIYKLVSNAMRTAALERVKALAAEVEGAVLEKPAADASLETVLEFCLDQKTRLGQMRADNDAQAAVRVEAAHLLMPRVDSSSSEAESMLRGKILAEKARLEAFRSELAFFITEQDKSLLLGVEQSLLAALREPAGERLPWMAQASDVLKRAATEMDGVAERILAVKRPLSSAEVEAVRAYLDSSHYNLAASLLLIARKRQRCFEPGFSADTLQFGFMHSDKAFGKSLSGAFEATRDLALLDSEAKIEHAKIVLDEVIREIDARGGASEVMNVLREELQRRVWSCLEALRSGDPKEVEARFRQMEMPEPKFGDDPSQLAIRLRERVSGQDRNLLVQHGLVETGRGDRAVQ